MIIWEQVHPDCTFEHLGLIPSFLDEDDPRDAKEQFDAKYISGWTKFEGHTMSPDGSLKYPEDPPLPVLARCQFRTELILFYEYAWVAVVQPDGSYEICRMD